VIDPQTLAHTLADLGQPAYRTGQVYRALARGLVTDFAQISELPASLRRDLAGRLVVQSLVPRDELVSPRGAVRKALLEAGDGCAVEAVLMTYRRRATVCVSTQVGCAVGCPFCASGALGLARDLRAEEMVDQVLHFARLLTSLGRRVTNVVFMGMGEPFHVYDETLRACRLLNDPEGFALAARGISVSTAGVVPGIRRFATEPLQLNLAVSLHAATDELRDRLVPLNRRYPLDELFAVCEDYVEARGRKLFFEYVVLAAVNDGDDQVAALARRLRRPLYHLNLIACNETGGEFARPGARDLAALADRLRHAGVACTMRRSPGGEIAAACGQLALRSRGVGQAGGCGCGRSGGREAGGSGAGRRGQYCEPDLTTM
jgi:23S rRNA (adenine2503-C2)-methyltransferase